jgi:hypothetical protein
MLTLYIYCREPLCSLSNVFCLHKPLIEYLKFNLCSVQYEIKYCCLYNTMTEIILYGAEIF